MAITTFNRHKSLSASEKVLLARLQGSKRLVGWTLDSGSIYQISFAERKVINIYQDGTALTEVSSQASISAGKYYHDRENARIFIQTSDSSNPDTKFIACIFEMFFSTHPVRAAHDLSTGFDVEWISTIKDAQSVGVELDHSRQNLGSAIEGSGSLRLLNDHSFWGARYDKYFFENRRVLLYQYNRALPISEAKLIYRGTVQRKTWAPDTITFSLKDVFSELRGPLPASTLSEISGARLPTSLQSAKQRTVYGKVHGHVCVSYDQIVNDYPLTGTVTIQFNSQTVSGSGTSALSELSPGDEIVFAGEEDTYTISGISTDTSFSITEPYVGSNAGSGVSFVLSKPAKPKRYANRTFKIAGHALRNPTTTVSAPGNNLRFTIDDDTDFSVGDQIEVNGETRFIRSISQSKITVTQALSTAPQTSDTVKRSSVQNVYLNNKKLFHSRGDYTYSAANGTLTLSTTCERNLAATESMPGTVTIQNGNRSVTGSSTAFTSLLTPGDWIRGSGNTNWLEVLSVESDTALTLRTIPGASDAASGTAAQMKRPEVFNESEDVISCDVLGKTDDGTTTGNLLKYPRQITEDILKTVGLSSQLNTASFAVDDIEGRHEVGLVTPEKFDDVNNEIVRDVIKRSNRSVFGTIYQNDDFEIAWSQLSTRRLEANVTQLDEHDILNISVKSDNSNLVQYVTLTYAHKEYDPFSGLESLSSVTSQSEISSYLATTEKRYEEQTSVVSANSARILANRWRFLLERSQNKITVQTKLQTTNLTVNDLVRIEHPSFYQRFGSTSKIRIGLITSISKTAGTVTLTIDDLSNAFARCGTITTNDASTWDNSSTTEKEYNAYVTESNGMIGSNTDTYGINQIW